MTSVWQFLMAHQTTSALVAFWVLSNFASSLPSPNSASNGFYKWFFAFANGTVGSMGRIFPNLRLPNDPTANSPTYFSNGSTKPNGPTPLVLKK